MNNFKKLYISLATVIFPLIFVQTTLACLRTPGEVPFCHIFQSSQAVFVGEVIKSEPHNIVPSNPNLSSEKKAAWTYKYERLTFVVTETFKGAVTGEFEALNLTEIVMSCDTIAKIKIGQKWVIFAYQHDGKNEFYVSPVSFFYDETKEAEKLGYLRAVLNNETKTGIYGQFTANYPASLIKIEGYKVIAENNGKRLTAKMDKYGQYAFPTVSGGTFKIKIYIPFNAYLQEGNDRTNFIFDDKTELYTLEYETTVKEHECAYKQIRAFPVAPNNGEDK